MTLRIFLLLIFPVFFLLLGAEVTKKSYTNCTPDSHGVIETKKLDLGEYQDAVLFASQWWPGGGNRLYPRIKHTGELNDGFDGGLMLVLKRSNFVFETYLAGVNNDLFSWLSTPDGDSYFLKTGHLGKNAYSGENKIVLIRAKGTSVYESITNAWIQYLNDQDLSATVDWRDNKTYHEYFKYLGWCSWESYHMNIDEKTIVDAINILNTSDIPIRYALIDDGHQKIFPGTGWHYNGLTDFGPIEDKFPNGYDAILDLRKEDSIKWMGLWLSFLGGRDGIHPENKLADELNDSLSKTHMNTLVPSGKQEDAKRFYSSYVGEHITDPGWDFTKVDFQSRALTHYGGGKRANLPIRDNRGSWGNAFEAAASLTLAFENQLQKDDLGVINCNSLSPFAIFNSSYSSVARCSEDYKLYDLGRARNHLHYSYGSMPLVGQVFWGDHDMFHSTDTVSGTMMAISKAMSGGPIYLSDKPGHSVKENIIPLCYTDGELLRPLAPAVPTEASFFIDAQSEPKAYHAFAPLVNDAVAIVGYNLYSKILLNNAVYTELVSEGIPESVIRKLKESGVEEFENNDKIEVFLRDDLGLDPNESKYRQQIKNTLNNLAEVETVTGTIEHSIYKNAGVMLQPKVDSWELPEEGLLCFDWYKKKVWKLDEPYQYQIDGFGDKLFHLVPIQNGWGIIGNVNKFLSPATYAVEKRTPDKLVLTMKEGGRFFIWNHSDVLKSDRGHPILISSGLWSIDIPVDCRRVTIERFSTN